MDTNSYLYGVLILSGALVYFLGNRMAKTKEEFNKLTIYDRYLGLLWALLVSSITFFWPIISNNEVFIDIGLLPLLEFTLNLVALISIVMIGSGLVLVAGNFKNIRKNFK